jgi:hypothetical protein
MVDSHLERNPEPDRPSPLAPSMGISEDSAVSTHQGNAKLASLGDQEAIGGIGVEVLRQTSGKQRHQGIQRQPPHRRQSDNQRQPVFHLHVEHESAPLREHGRFPTADCQATCRLLRRVAYAPDPEDREETAQSSEHGS